MRKSLLISITGWAGVALVLIVFIATTFGMLQSSDLLYGILNALGALGVIISSLAKKDFQPVVLNIVWLLVALSGLAMAILR